MENQMADLMRNDIVLFSLFCWFTGACLASFYHLVAERMVEGKSFIWGRSKCPNCGHTLRWLDILPIVNFVLLKGRCHFCRAPISPIYPLTEIIGAFLVLSIGILWGPTTDALLLLLFFSLLFILGDIDSQVLGMPLSLLGMAFVAGGLCGRFVFHLSPSSMFLGGMAAAFLFWLTGQVGRVRLTEDMKQAGFDALGNGDIILAGILGVTFGLRSVFGVIVVACMLGVVAGLIIKLAKRPEEPGKIILPFGPYLGAGAFLWLIGIILIHNLWMMRPNTWL